MNDKRLGTDPLQRRKTAAAPQAGSAADPVALLLGGPSRADWDPALVLEEACIPFLALSGDGRVVYANQAFRDLSGMGPEALAGAAWDELFQVVEAAGETRGAACHRAGLRTASGESMDILIHRHRGRHGGRDFRFAFVTPVAGAAPAEPPTPAEPAKPSAEDPMAFPARPELLGAEFWDRGDLAWVLDTVLGRAAAWNGADGAALDVRVDAQVAPLPGPLGLFLARVAYQVLGQALQRAGKHAPGTALEVVLSAAQAPGQGGARAALEVRDPRGGILGRLKLDSKELTRLSRQVVDRGGSLQLVRGKNRDGATTAVLRVSVPVSA